MKLHKLGIIASSLFAILLFVVQYAGVQAGIYDEDTGTTYKEVWIDHKEFTGGCGASERPFGTWYVEPLGFNNVCQKVLDFTLPNDFANATKIEVYMDIWRGHTPPSVRFSINGKPERASAVGLEWSRTPLIMQLPTSEFVPGANTIKVWNGGGAYHIHDIAFRLYYAPAAPLVGQNPPNAQLTRIIAANGVFTPAVGGTLDIDNDQIKLVASNVSGNAKFIEFHAYYEGYDEDNDGASTDWHSRSINNCHPGGIASSCDLPAGIGGTIDHIGTLPVTGASAYTMTWNIPYIQGQSGVRFKVRVVTADNNVRDAAGDASAPFTLKRNKAVTVFTIPNYADDVLYADGSKPTLVERYIELPADVLTYDQAYFIGSYWKNPFFRFNTSTTKIRAFDSGESDWKLSIRPISVAQLVPGTNLISYEYNGGYGQFIENPGPMIVLRRTGAGPGNDVTPPWAHRELPASGSIYMDPASSIHLQLYDSNAGVDESSIEMTVNGVTVAPQIVGDKFNYKLSYKPAAPFALGSSVTVVVNAKDLANNVMAPKTFSFTIRPASQPAALASDDFNACALNANRWTFVNPTGDASYQMLGDKIAISVPAGSEHDVWTGKKTAPRIVQSITNGNFEAIVKFDSIFNLAAGLESQGLLVGNETDFIRFNVQYDGSDIRAFLRIFANGVAIGDNAKSKVLTGDTTPPAYLRIVRTDPKWSFYYSKNGTSWTSLAEFNRVMTVSEISIFAANGNTNPPHTAIVDYFFNAASPINPEDPKALVLPVTVVGNGTVTKDAECGNPVTLTAVPALGWKFDGFTGAATTTDNPFTFSFAQGNTLTARFSQANYSLVTNVVDETGAPSTGGRIFATAPINPAGYTLNESLTLTATPKSGWNFLGWSGSASGTNPIINLTAQSNMVVTGTFEQQHYALNLTLLNENGQPITSGPTISVTAPADPDGYVFGERADLTVTVQPGWTFLGWSGDLTGGSPTKSLLFNGPKSVTATFRQAHYALNLSVVNENGRPVGVGGPSVTVTPPADPAGYIFGETIELTTVDQPGWSFQGWSGDLSGSESSKTLTFDGAKSVTATFQQAHFALTMNVVDSNGQPITNGPTVSVPAPASAAGYVLGETITVTAVTKPGWTFLGWSGDLTGTEVNKSLSFDGAKTVTATFQQEHYTISVTVVDDKGAAVADAADVTITPPASAEGYVHGEEVTITLAPKNGWNFFGWQDGLTGSENPITFDVTGNLAVKAVFTRKLTLNLRYNDSAGGTITPNPAGPYEFGQQVQLTVVANPGWQFTGWSGALSGNDNPATITMDGSKTVRANFAQIAYTLTQGVSGTNGNGTVTLTPNQATYRFGDEVSLTAAPAADSTFTGWEVTPNNQSGLDLSQPTIKITISDNTTFIAKFVLNSNPPTLHLYLPMVSN